MNFQGPDPVHHFETMKGDAHANIFGIPFTQEAEKNLIQSLEDKLHGKTIAWFYSALLQGDDKAQHHPTGCRVG
jgi:hypothetical protein